MFITAQASANPLVWAVVTVTLAGNPQTPFFVPLLQESPLGTYQFKFDLQAMLQDAVAPYTNAVTTVFGPINAPYMQQVGDELVNYEVFVEYLYVDPTTGLLTSLVATDTSSTFYAITATRQSTGAQDFTGYIPQAGSPNDQLWLTNAPQEVDVCDNENLWLTHISDAAADRYRVRTYDAAGVLIDTGDFIADTDGSEVTPQSIGVGIANLATQVYSAGAVTLPNPLVAYYTITLFNSAVPFIEFIQIRRFNVVDCCEDSIRLHWLNILGGADAYTFKKLQKKDVNVQSEFGQKARDTTYSINDKGAFKYQISGATVYEATSDPLTPDVAAWLGELALSVEVYRETTSGLVPVVVRTETMPVEKSTTNELDLVVINISFVDANEIIAPHA